MSQDDSLCIKISGSVLTLDNDLFFCLSYVVPVNSSRQAIMQEHTFDIFLSFIAELNSTHEHAFYFVLCGDMNAHTSNNADFVFDDSLSNVDVTIRL